MLSVQGKKKREKTPITSQCSGFFLRNPEMFHNSISFLDSANRVNNGRHRSVVSHGPWSGVRTFKMHVAQVQCRPEWPGQKASAHLPCCLGRGPFPGRLWLFTPTRVAPSQPATFQKHLLKMQIEKEFGEGPSGSHRIGR